MIINKIPAKPIRNVLVPAGPSVGNKYLAIDAPPCTLIIESKAAGMAIFLFFLMFKTKEFE